VPRPQRFSNNLALGSFPINFPAAGSGGDRLFAALPILALWLLVEGKTSYFLLKTPPNLAFWLCRLTKNRGLSNIRVLAY